MNKTDLTEENFAYLRDVLGVKYLPLEARIEARAPLPDQAVVMPRQFNLMFVGEGLGRKEEADLLSKMILAMGFKREDVHVTDFESAQAEMNVIDPQVIVALGDVAAQGFLNSKEGVKALRGKILDFGGKRLVVTYHPTHLVKNSADKKSAWSDLQMVMAELKRLGL